ncbi:hypothetical protein RUND412_002799 [Rhizina undulata]
MPRQSKFYAVSSGRQTGIFTDWQKSFLTRVEVENWFGREVGGEAESVTAMADIGENFIAEDFPLLATRYYRLNTLPPCNATIQEVRDFVEYFFCSNGIAVLHPDLIGQICRE